MRKFIKHLYRSTTIGHSLLSPAKRLYDLYSICILTEKAYLKRLYKMGFGFDLDLENPKKIQEKFLWLRLNDKTPLHTLCADKYAVREHIKDKIGEQYLVPLVYRTDNPADIIPDNLPDYPFIIKTNHGCGGHVIVKDKSVVNWKKVQKNLKKSLKTNFYYNGREWQYKDIEPCIVVEKLLLDKNQSIPYDYKLHCYNGKVLFIEVRVIRYTDKYINYYDPEWKIMDLRCLTVPNGIDIERPAMLKKMKSLAEILSKEFRYVRVDLYNFSSKIYFGELTFYPCMGLQRYIPVKWNRIFGDELKL